MAECARKQEFACKISKVGVTPQPGLTAGGGHPIPHFRSYLQRGLFGHVGGSAPPPVLGHKL